MHLHTAFIKKYEFIYIILRIFVSKSWFMSQMERFLINPHYNRVCQEGFKMTFSKAFGTAALAVVMGLGMVGCSSSTEEKVEDKTNEVETDAKKDLNKAEEDLKDSEADVKNDAEKVENKAEEVAEDAKDDAEEVVKDAETDAQNAENAVKTDVENVEADASANN